MKNRIQATVSQWPGVKIGKLYGNTALMVKRKPFLILKDGSIGLANLNPHNREKAIQSHEGGPFLVKGKVKADWIEIPVRTIEEYRAIEFLIEASYQAAHMAL